MGALIFKEKIDERYLSNHSKDYTTPKKKQGKLDFNAFAGTLGSKKLANISSAIGFISIDVKSQFWKMLTAKNNRSSTLFNIKDTLKNPIVIFQDGDSFKYFAAYKKKNSDKLFCMMSVCTLDEVGKGLILKTSYQMKDLSAVKRLLDRSIILYEKDNHELNNAVRQTREVNKSISIEKADLRLVTAISESLETVNESVLSLDKSILALQTKDTNVVSGVNDIVKRVNERELERPSIGKSL